MPAQPPPAGPGVYFVVTIIILVAVLFVGMLLLRLSAYLAARRTLSYEQKQRYGVKRFDAPPSPVQAPRPEWSHMSSQRVGPEHRIAAVPSTDTKSVPSPVPAQNDLTYDEAVRRAAAIRVNGKWWMSGKKLYSVVGGNHARFLEIVSEVRGDVAAEDVPPAKAAAVSPIAGRAYDPKQFHSDNPELQYVDP